MKHPLVIACLFLALSGCAERRAQWAQPVKVAGVPNLHRVSDTLYRSAEPTAQGLQQLPTLGIATVINLQRYRSDREQVEALGLTYEQIPLDPWQPDEREVIAFLKLVTNPAGAPYLVHCQHGADRAGVMCAVYRIAVQGWSKQDALREMQWGGYGYHWHMGHLVTWVSELDIDRLKTEAGIHEPLAVSR